MTDLEDLDDKIGKMIPSDSKMTLNRNESLLISSFNTNPDLS